MLAKAMGEIDDLYPLFAQAAALVFTTGYASVPMLRRRMPLPEGVAPLPESMAVGFLELMEAWGLVGPADSTGIRKVLLS